MEACEHTSTDSCINVEIFEEIDAVKAIYEGQISSDIIDNEAVTVTLHDAKLLITFHIDRNYPDKIPDIKVLDYIGESIEIINILEKCANENRGNPMIYILIEKALDIISNDEANESISPSKTQCKFYMQGKCKFGAKCFNLHGSSLESNMDICSEKNMDCESKLGSQNSKTYVDDIDVCKLRSQHSTCRTGDDDSMHDKKYRKTSKVDLHGGEKKKSMKTAIDVINRIMWDDSFPTENFIVGYLDRFLGVQEKPFTAFSWEDIASVDYNVLAIPKHRIQYFKYKSVVIWDKNKRLDKVFGSTGDIISVMDIINNNESIPDMNINNGDDDEEVNDNVLYVTKNRPNYFMCLRISDEEVKQNIVKIQDGITFYDDRLKSVLFKPDDFHITLCMMRLNNEGDFINAGAVLKSLERILVCMLPLNNSYVTLKGVNDFRGQVIIAEVACNPVFNKFVEIAKLKLKSAGIKLVGNHEPYCPHLSLLKLNRPFCREQSIDSINNMYYSEFKDISIGKQPVDEIRICSTGEERGYDDFYVSLSSISNNLFCVNSKLPSLIATFIQNLMSAGLILEDDGDHILSEILSNDPKRFEQIVLSLETLLPSYLAYYIASRKHVIIMRGLPGSGKTYFVQNLQETSGDICFSVCSADQYFQVADSGYKFSDDEIASAHIFCQDKFIDCIAQKYNIIVVDNTHLQKWEYQIYQRIALLCGYTSHVISIDCDNETLRNELYKRCQHNIKPLVHKEMFERYRTDEEAICIDSDAASINLNDLLNHGSMLSLCSSSVLYSALYLDEDSQHLLSSMYPPVHEHVSCDHVTLIYEPSITDLSKISVGVEKCVNVTGYVLNNCIQAVIVNGMVGELCSNNKKHVTISTNKSTPAKDVQYWIDYQPCIPSKSEIILTGVIGVQIATSKTKSKKCIDADQFSLIVSKLGAESHGGKQGPSNDYSRKIPSSEESPVVDPGLYFGPDVIKSLFIFDFDGTLFNTPDPAEGRIEYEHAAGHRWPYRGWLGHPESLQYPLHVYPGPSLSDYFEHYERACSITVLLTGRMERVRPGLEPILAINGLTFAKVIMKPQYSLSKETSSVHGYKKEIVKNLMKELPHLESVKFWDDRKDNIVQLKNLQKTIKNVKIDTFHVDATLPNFHNMTIYNLLKRMGIRPSIEFNAGVKEGLNYISLICKDVLGVTDERNVLFPFGSYLLGRRGDVDVCVLAPSHLHVDQYINKLGEKAQAYGLEYVHVAPGIRCPLVKLKLKYLNLPPIEFDIVIATILDNDNDCYNDLDFEMLHKKCVDKKSKAALDGLIFFNKIVAPTLDRVDVNDFGIIIDVINIILKLNNLKGNVFHCIRTFHIVKMLAEFIESCSKELLPIEGWKKLKEFEKFIRNFLKYLSEKTTEEYRKLFKGFVPDVYIEPLRKCFLESSRCRILDILCTAPRPSKAANVTIELQSTNKALIWSGMCLTEARLGTCIRKLIQNGVTIYPVAILHNMISFNAVPFNICRHTLMNFKEELHSELPPNTILKINLL